MNNSKIALEVATLAQENAVDIKPQLREREQKLVTIIEAIREIKQMSAWSTLKEHIFDSLTESLKRDLLVESRKDSPDTLKLNRVSGQLKWAERFANLDKLEEGYKTELFGLRKQLYG